MATSTERLHLTIEDQIADRYLRVPFEIGASDSSLTVQLDYDTSAGVIDLGCEGARAWRGWSGGSRDHFTITAAAATPGYLPGAPEAGTWHVILGLHKVPATGLDVMLRISTPAVEQPEAEREVPPQARQVRGSDRNLPAPAGLRWYAGDFHAHTVHSDGSLSIGELAATGVRAGLDFLAVTDHNTTSHHACLPRVGAAHGISLLPGQEVTTARGHANAFGDIGWVDFRDPADTWVADVARRGGVLSINHPIDGDCAWQHPLAKLPAALELWHISWFRDLTSTAPWAFHQRWDTAATILGGSDFHSPDQGYTLGTPTTWVAAEDDSPEEILAGVKAGRTAISVGVGEDGVPQPLHTPVLLRVDDDVVAVSAAGTILVDAAGRRRRITGETERIPATWGTGRLHLQDADRRVLAIA